jgi:Fe-S-cluster containining protein
LDACAAKSEVGIALSDDLGLSRLPLNPPVPTDCQRCGVCCYSPSAEYVWVTGHDWEQLGADAETLAHFISNRAFMKMADGHCAALKLITGQDAQPFFVCSIYDRRPEICRVLERGSPECLADLETKAEQVAQQSSPACE